MDKLKYYEIYDILRFIPYVYRAGWDQTRLLSLVIAQKFCKKKLKLKDMFSLPWDDEKHSLEMSKEAEEKNRYFQDYILQLINKKTDEQKHG